MVDIPCVEIFSTILIEVFNALILRSHLLQNEDKAGFSFIEELILPLNALSAILSGKIALANKKQFPHGMLFFAD